MYKYDIEDRIKIRIIQLLLLHMHLYWLYSLLNQDRAIDTPTDTCLDRKERIIFWSHSQNSKERKKKTQSCDSILPEGTDSNHIEDQIISVTGTISFCLIHQYCSNHRYWFAKCWRPLFHTNTNEWFPTKSVKFSKAKSKYHSILSSFDSYCIESNKTPAY